DARLRLRDLLTKLDGNDELDKLLQEVVHDPKGLSEIRSAHPQLFDMSSFTELGVPRDLSKVFETIDMARWREFRKSEDSR
ncbi:type VI secretion system contractile sheath large subunit, partial [Paraburkholderia sp. EG285A]|uniref:type VI secretion system contractile sheath domain-containing protein n=1 Tax=Paraburkholderia sp. EG285A TaxID=3237009 RepID=UPI0034D20A93